MPSHRQTSGHHPSSSGRHRRPDVAPAAPSASAPASAGGRHRGAPAPKSRYATVATTAILGAGIVALGTAASFPAQGGALPSAVAAVDSPVAGVGVGDGMPAIHGTARYDSRVGFTAARADRTRTTADRTLLPAGMGRLSSCFCWRWGSHHDGIDLATPMLTPIYAAEDGVVKKAGTAAGFGNAVVITHDATTETLYGHMQKILVREGQRVRAGQIIALSGNQGHSTGPHLHFEVHINGTPIDPIPWLERRGFKI